MRPTAPQRCAEHERWLIPSSATSRAITRVLPRGSSSWRARSRISSTSQSFVHSASSGRIPEPDPTAAEVDSRRGCRWTPWTRDRSGGRRVAALRAARAHDALGRRARSRGTRRPLRARRLRRAGHNRPLAPHRRAPTERLLVLPSAELNCVLPAGRRRHVLAFGIEADPAALGAEYADLADDGRLDRAARRRRLPRAPLLERRPSPDVRAARERGRDRGLQRGLRARGRARLAGVHWDEALERGRRAASRIADRRLAPSRLRLRPRVGVGRARRAFARGRARGAPRGAVLPADRAAIVRVSVDDGAVEVRAARAAR